LYGVYFVFALLWPIPAALIMVPVAASLLFFSPRVLSQNLVLAIALAGVACQFASFVSFPVALALIIILSLYDIVAVNVTHHMVAMAKSVIKVHLPVVFVMPWKAQDLSEHVQRFEPGSSAVFLGAGDIAFPAILVATAPTTTTSVAITLGALAGFFILTVSFLGGKKQHPLPALPFLTVSILIALGLSLLV
jgi:presenilin-like A22 family membrane protease